MLNHIIEKKRVNYIIDADIRTFFDNVDHEWLMKFLELRIADKNLLRIIKRFLIAGVMEGGIVHDTPSGTPQGGVISPILANVYLHYVLDLWFEKVVRRQCEGEAYLVRYADDGLWKAFHRLSYVKFFAMVSFYPKSAFQAV